MLDNATYFYIFLPVALARPAPPWRPRFPK